MIIKASMIATTMLLGLVLAGQAEANDAHCLVRAGEDVTNTCGHRVDAAWRQDGSWRVWHFGPGDTNHLPGLVRSVDVVVCDARSGGGVELSGGRASCRGED